MIEYVNLKENEISSGIGQKIWPWENLPECFSKFFLAHIRGNITVTHIRQKPLEGFQFKIKYVGENTIINIIICGIYYIICQNMKLMTDMLCRRIHDEIHLNGKFNKDFLLVTKISKLSPTHSISKIRHQHRCNPILFKLMYLSLSS